MFKNLDFRIEIFMENSFECRRIIPMPMKEKKNQGLRFSGS